MKNKEMFKYFKYNIYSPKMHNVMIKTLYVALNLGFKKISIFGLDHNFLQEIFIDKNNFVNKIQDDFTIKGNTQASQRY